MPTSSAICHPTDQRDDDDGEDLVSPATEVVRKLVEALDPLEQPEDCASIGGSNDPEEKVEEEWGQVNKATSSGAGCSIAVDPGVEETTAVANDAMATAMQEFNSQQTAQLVEDSADPVVLLSASLLPIEEEEDPEVAELAQGMPRNEMMVPDANGSSSVEEEENLPRLGPLVLRWPIDNVGDVENEDDDDEDMLFFDRMALFLNDLDDGVFGRLGSGDHGSSDED